MDADGRDANVIFRPEGRAICTDSRVPRVELIKGYAVLLRDVVAIVIFLDEIELVAVGDHACLDGLWRVDTICRCDNRSARLSWTSHARQGRRRRCRYRRRCEYGLGGENRNSIVSLNAVRVTIDKLAYRADDWVLLVSVPPMHAFCHYTHI